MAFRENIKSFRIQLQELAIHITAIILDKSNHETFPSQKMLLLYLVWDYFHSNSLSHPIPAHKMHPCQCVVSHGNILSGAFFSKHIICSFYFSNAPMQSKSLLVPMFLSPLCHMPLFLCLPYPNSTFLFPFTLLDFAEHGSLLHVSLLSYYA